MVCLFEYKNVTHVNSEYELILIQIDIKYLNTIILQINENYSSSGNNNYVLLAKYQIMSRAINLPK